MKQRFVKLSCSVTIRFSSINRLTIREFADKVLGNNLQQSDLLDESLTYCNER